jgi:hypothetical protein
VLQKERLVTATLNNHKYTKESASELFMGQHKPPINTLPQGIKKQERETDNTPSLISGAFMA